MTAAMRLLGLIPAKAPTPTRPRSGWCEDLAGFDDQHDEEEDDGLDEVPSGPPPTPARLWGLEPDGEGGWSTLDGRPAMPGRDLHIVKGRRGLYRLLDITPEAADPYIEMIETAPTFDADDFNRLAYPEGGPLWDPVTRTLANWPGRPDTTPFPTSCAPPPAAPTPSLSPLLQTPPPCGFGFRSLDSYLGNDHSFPAIVFSHTAQM
jgi:hypothetical protein